MSVLCAFARGCALGGGHGQARSGTVWCGFVFSCIRVYAYARTCVGGLAGWDMLSRMTIRELLSRLAWTVVAAAGGVIVAAPAVNLDVLQAAATTALIAAVNLATLEARRRLSKQ